MKEKERQEIAIKHKIADFNSFAIWVSFHFVSFSLFCRVPARPRHCSACEGAACVCVGVGEYLCVCMCACVCVCGPVRAVGSIGGQAATDSFYILLGFI